jgi:1,4-dihydroxy-2-naphthoate polyprenyltransferase
VATLAQWVQGARPRTLPNAVAPVLAGTGAAVGAGGFRPVEAVLALVVAISMVIGVNYATAAFGWLGLGLVAGLALVLLTRHWWLLVVGVACVLGAWFYTGGRRPYGYAGLGEVAVFVFFGPVAVLGTSYVQSGPPGWLAVLTSAGVGMLSCSVLVANNLRDIDSDREVGKRTLAVLLGDGGTRKLYAALVGVPFLITLGMAVSAPWVLLALVAAVPARSPVGRVLGGVRGRELIAVLGASGLVMLVWSLGTAVGLSLHALR